MGYLFALFVLASANANTLHMSLTSEPPTFDWSGQVTMTGAPIVVNLCEGLFEFEPTSEKFIQAIAKSVTKSKDLTEYTFKIRDNAKWSDGREIYAKDFVDAWQRVLSPQTTSIYSYYLFTIANAKEYNSKEIRDFDQVGVHAIGDKTLVVKLNHPQKNWEFTTSFWPLFPVRKDLIEKYGNNWWKAGTLVTSGPFILKSLEPGKKAILERNPFYRKTLSNVDKVEIDFVLDQKEGIKKFKEKYYPFINITGMDNDFDQKDYHLIPMLRHYVIITNTKKFPFNNKYFRLAVLSSINRDSLIPDKNQQFTKAMGLIPPPLFPNNEDLSVPYNPEKAKEYLKKSNILIGKSTSIYFLNYIYEPYFSFSKKIASQIESTFGVLVNNLAYQNEEYEVHSRLREYDMLIESWTAKIRNPQDFLIPYSSEYSSNNRSFFSNNEYDQAIDHEDFKKAQLIISQENGVIYPIFFEKTGYLSHNNIKNLHFDYKGNVLLKDIILTNKSSK